VGGQNFKIKSIRKINADAARALGWQGASMINETTGEEKKTHRRRAEGDSPTHFFSASKRKQRTSCNCVAVRMAFYLWCVQVVYDVGIGMSRWAGRWET
jgi:hypothetical protein